MAGFCPPCMIVAESWRSSAVSTAVTSASESSSPHGVCTPAELRYQSLKSVSPALAASLPSASKTQCRGNLLAPTTSKSEVPSDRIVSASVVQTSGGFSRKKGGCFTWRGAGSGARPPVVCTKRTSVPLISGSRRRSGSATGSNIALFRATLTLVEAHAAATAVPGVDDVPVVGRRSRR